MQPAATNTWTAVGTADTHSTYQQLAGASTWLKDGRNLLFVPIYYIAS